jgi:shikimate kinase
MAPRHVVMVGLMGSGKTTIGELVAQRLGLSFVDSDVELERRTGHTARELLDREGADRMHELEASVVRDALDSPERLVVGAPASIVLTAPMRERLRREYVVYLHADPHSLAERLAHTSDKHRPFVDQGPDVLLRQYAERDALYREVASLVVDVTRRDKNDIVDEIIAALDQPSGR